jgi:hypothetical protein
MEVGVKNRSLVAQVITMAPRPRAHKLPALQEIQSGCAAIGTIWLGMQCDLHFSITEHTLYMLLQGKHSKHSELLS